MHFRKCVGMALAMALVSGFVCAPSGNMQAATAPAAAAVPPVAPPAPLVEQYLTAGKLTDGEAAMLVHLRAHPSDDQARFGLGVLQFVRAIERLSQDMYRYGVHGASTHGLRLPFLRMPVPANPKPQALSYQQARQIARTMLDNLSRAEATMAPIKDTSVKLPLHFGMIRLDLNGDGRADEAETLWQVYAGLNRSAGLSEQTAQQFYITFDRGDVHWLRGYCHLLSSVLEVYLAHDTRETFDCTAHLFFPKVESPYGFLARRRAPEEGRRRFHEFSDIVDLVALVHLIRWDVAEPARMAAALHHLEAVVAQSRESWKSILAETDDDREWLPNPRQTGVIPNVRVSQEMIDAWLGMMGQLDLLLQGQALIPFWRGGDGYGIDNGAGGGDNSSVAGSRSGYGLNLRRVFLEPRRFDLVLWVQGPGAVPYLETGRMTDRDVWRELPRVFGGQFPGFAAWFN